MGKKPYINATRYITHNSRSAQNEPSVRCPKDRHNCKVTTEEERVEAALTKVSVRKTGYIFQATRFPDFLFQVFHT
jgi:hypothetical protein